jgi:hypothetical protein
VQRRFAIDLPLSALFRLPTVQALVRHVAEALGATQGTAGVSRPPLKPRVKSA